MTETNPKPVNHMAPCPSCGYCPTCGRKNAAPVYPYPWGVYPYNPWWQTWTVSGTTTFPNTTTGITVTY